jgi:pimeloyl-ACP methyl ester carboxylesterase
LETQALYLDDTYVHYARAGDGEQTVIILHGWAASLKQWEWFLPILANAGYTAYAVDLLGHGEAPPLSQDHTIQDYLDYMRRWTEAMEIRQPILIGHSMGGYLSLQYALDNPGAMRGLVLVDPLYSYHQFDKYHQHARRLLGKPEMLKVGEFVFCLAPAWLFAAGQKWGLSDVNGAPVPLRQQVALDHKRADPHNIQIIAIIGDLRPRLAQVSAPALVTWGGKDRLLSPASFEVLVDRLPAAQGYCFEDVGHHPPLARTKAFTELILAFLHQLEDDNLETATASTRVSHLWASSTTTVPSGL